MSHQVAASGLTTRVAYLCMEFALDEALPIYAGGLGVLAGDFLRSAHALGLPVVGVGLLWDEGYTTQRLDDGGRALDLPTPHDRRHLVREAATATVTVAGHEVRLAIWRATGLDAAPLYLLEPIAAADRWITRRLYGGGSDERIAQEIVLGVGAVRALEALGIDVDVYHFNEGHALFAGLELIRRARAAGRGFDDAWAETRARVVFTTHTPIEAGNEQHEFDRLIEMGVAAGLGFHTTELERLGGRPFNMTAAALRLSRRANAVSVLHGETARKMWRHVADAAPIGDITNGVDARVWQDGRIARALADGSDDALAAARAACRRDLVREVERRTGVRLDPERLTLVFARRATAYKRATLVLHDEARLDRLLADGRAQLVFAGKAHPRDQGGRELVQALHAAARRFPGRLVFVPDYDLALGRCLTRGADVWLNTPRRPLEACGTSGMKAAMNGGLNLSILDGWWPEACEHGVNGWRIDAALQHGMAVEALASAERDALDAAELYRLLEDEVLPLWSRDRRRWLAMARAAAALADRFSSDRMLRDYYERLYAGDADEDAGEGRPAAAG